MNHLPDLQFKENFSQQHNGIKSLRVWEFNVSDYPWMEESIKNGKNIPIEIEFNDGTIVKAILAKLRSPEELQVKLEAKKRCDEFNIEHLKVLGSYSSEDSNYIVTEFMEGLVPLSIISYPIKEILDHDLRKLISLINKIHLAGIFHGDLEPLNIGFTDKGIFVYDFSNSKIYPPGEVPEEEKRRDWEQFTDKIMRIAWMNRTHSAKITFQEIKDVIKKYGLSKYVPHFFES